MIFKLKVPRRENGRRRRVKRENIVLRVRFSPSPSPLLFKRLYLVTMETCLKRLSREASQRRYLVWKTILQSDRSAAGLARCEFVKRRRWRDAEVELRQQP